MVKSIVLVNSVQRIGINERVIINDYGESVFKVRYTRDICTLHVVGKLNNACNLLSHGKRKVQLYHRRHHYIIYLGTIP